MDGATLAAPDDDQLIHLWSTGDLDAEPETVIHLHYLTKPDMLQVADGRLPTPALASSPDGETLATADVPRTVRLGRLADLETPYVSLQGHGHYDVMTLAFSPDGRYLASGGGDALVNVWVLASEQ